MRTANDARIEHLIAIETSVRDIVAAASRLPEVLGDRCIPADSWEWTGDLEDLAARLSRTRTAVSDMVRVLART